MKTSKKFRLMVIGFGATLIISVFAVPSFAAKIEQLFNSVNISINGKKVATVGESYTLGDGTVVPFSIAYNGTTYLPLRKIGELFEKSIMWENDTKTAVINDYDYVDFPVGKPETPADEKLKAPELIELKKPPVVVAVEPSITEEDITPVNYYGNTSANMNNGGFAAEQGKWIYYVDINKHSIKKVSKDGTKEKTAYESVDGIPYYLNVVGEWIYYFAYSKDTAKYGIYKVRINGTGNTRICFVECDIKYMIVADDYIYYTTVDDSYLFRIKTDGTLRNRFVDEKCYSVIVSSDWVYYWSISEDSIYEGLCQISIDGLRKYVIRDGDSFKDMNLVDDEIYYCGSSNEIQRISVSGYYEAISTHQIGKNLNVSDEWMFYIRYGAVYKKLLKSGSEKLLLNGNYNAINVVGEWVYCRDNDTGRTDKIRIDGTGFEKGV